MTEFDAIFFDMDGTLVENSKLMPAAFQEGFAEFGYMISIDPWRGSGCTDYEVMDKYLADYVLNNEQKDEITEKIAAKVKDVVIEKVKWEGLVALPGTAELISKLNGAGIRPGLLTGNMEAIVEPKLEAAGMRRSDFYYGGFGDHSPNRPETARRALTSAAEYFGHEIDPARSLIIGDTPNDIACARAVNASVLAVATGRFSMEELGRHQPDYLLPNLCDHTAFFKILGFSPISK